MLKFLFSRSAFRNALKGLLLIGGAFALAACQEPVGPPQELQETPQQPGEATETPQQQPWSIEPAPQEPPGQE